MTLKTFRKFFSEEWIIVDKHKNAVISKHGDDQKGATIAARKMDFAEWNKTHKLGRFCPMATHGPGAMAPDVANLEPGGKPKPKKKPAKKAKTPAKKAPTKKPTGSKVKTPGQNSKGGLSSQIGGLIARHMAKMFKEEVLSPQETWKKNQEKSATKIVNKYPADTKRVSDVYSTQIISNKPTTTNNKPKINTNDPYPNDLQTARWLKHQSLMRKVAKEKELQHPGKHHSLLASLGHAAGHTLLHVAKDTLLASVNAQVERLLFETEEQPNYHVQILLDSGNIGNKNFRRHSIDTIRPIYTGAPNEPLDTKWLNTIIMNDEQIKEYQSKGYHIADIIGSDDPYQSEREMNERHARAVRVQDAVARRFLPKDEEI